MSKENKIQIIGGTEIISCKNKTPLVSLPDSGNPPIINYNLPQSTCFDASGIIPIDVDEKYFKNIESSSNSFNYNEYFEFYANSLLEQDRIQNFAHSLISTRYPNFQLLLNFRQWPLEQLREFHTQFVRCLRAFLDYPSEAPEIYQSLSGEILVRKVEVNFELNPQLFLVEHYKICSYASDYGAGKVLKTFSLLPGEKTTISIRSFKQEEEIRKKSENILDSFSTASANELEQILEAENNESNSSSLSSTQTNFNSKTVDKKLSASLTAGKGAASGTVGGSIGSTRTKSNGRETTINKSRDNNIRTLSNSISKQTSKADAFREVEVNIETSFTMLTETETNIIRKIENINKSRVLNFTFRQLLQGYDTFIYLDRVSLAYTTGEPDFVLLEDIGTSKSLLEEVVEGTTDEGNDVVDILFKQIIKQYCNVLDYKNEKHQFLEEIREELVDCFFGDEPEQFVYYRKRAKHFEGQNLKDEDVGHNLPGIVLNINKSILRTDSVIVDSILGHGEALDCFNLELQEATVTKAHLDNIHANLENRKVKEAINTLKAASDPESKAKLYEVFFKECCHEKIIIKDID